MNIFIVTAITNKTIVEDLKSKIKRHSIKSTLDETAENMSFLKAQMVEADTIFVLWDKVLSQNKEYLGLIERELKKHQNGNEKHLVLFNIGNISIPDFLRSVKMIALNSNELNTVTKIKKQIRKIENIELKRDPYYIHVQRPWGLAVLTVAGLVAVWLTFRHFGGAYYQAVISFFSSFSFSDEVSFLALLISGFSIILNASMNESKEKEDKDSLLYEKKLNQIIIENSNIDFSQNIDKECGGPEDDVREIVHEIYPQQSIDALKLMLINLEDINKFYRWSRKQAKSSFIFAIVMCVAGFLLIASAIVLSFLLKISDTALIISVVGGAITELISATSLLVYRTSLKQLNYYHKALHEDERFLSSINLIDKFKSSENYDEMLKEIIKSEIQLNILETKQEPDKSTQLR